MKTLAILSRKGGAGKTTLALHLAVIAETTGRRVLIVDCDPQRSATRWYEARIAAAPLLVAGEADKLPVILKAAEADGIDLVIVDSRPSVERDTALIAGRADLVLIPTRPAVLDLQAIGATIEVVKLAKRPAAIVLNACPPARLFGESAVAHDARTMLSGYQSEVAPVSITNRVALANALIDGRAVNELEPDSKAAREISKLWEWIEGQLWRKRRD